MENVGKNYNKIDICCQKKNWNTEDKDYSMICVLYVLQIVCTGASEKEQSNNVKQWKNQAHNLKLNFLKEDFKLAKYH